MPTYQYRAVEPGDECILCREGFEIMQRISEDALTECPLCSKPVQRIISAPSVIGGDAHRLRESHLDKHGFTQYRKVSKGVYEKTTGRGPDVISDDGK